MIEATDESIRNAREALDLHVRQIVDWHFSEATASPFWLQWAVDNGFDPAKEIQGYDDLLTRFGLFDDEVLRREPPERLVPRAYLGRPFHVFETGGTSGLPKQRLAWDDHRLDYDEFSRSLDESSFPLGSAWLMVGPTGPRRLRLSIEHLANLRGGPCYHVDVDPRWVKQLIFTGQFDQLKAYKAHVVDQARTLLRHRSIRCLFITPLLLEALGERMSLAQAGVRGVFCGGTTMTPEMVRFLTVEVLEGKVAFVPTYGNTLMGLAASRPLTTQDNFSVTYHAPQPRAVLRVVDPRNPTTTVSMGAWGRVELTTLTREFFMPRLLERDQAIRRGPCALYPWDGVGDVRPFEEAGRTFIEGVY